MPLLDGDEKVKNRKRLKTSTPNRLLTRLPVLLAQIKAGNNSHKLKKKTKKKTDKYCIFCINTIKSPKKITTIQSSHYKNGSAY